MHTTRAVRAYRKAGRIARGRALATLIRLGGGACGAGLEAEAGTVLRWGGHPGIQFGRNIRLGRGVILDVPDGGRLHIGDGVKVMHYTVVAAFESVTIGGGTQIGESCSIRDSDHGAGNSEVAMADDNFSTATVIGEGAWVGRGAAVLRGSHIGAGAFVGANSVVVSKRPIPPGTTAVGAPAEPILSSKKT